MIFAFSILLAAMSSADAVATILNSPASVSPKRYAEALEIVMREAKDGKPLQQYVIGVTTKDREIAFDYLESARPKIQAMAERTQNSLAWYLLSIETNDLKLLRRAADGGNVQAENAMGTILTQQAIERHMTGAALTNALVQSYSYFKSAAAQRDPNGFINLGTCYLRGLGCKQDLAMAFNAFLAAAKAGHPEGMDNLSACYQLGDGIPKDEKRSLYWRMRARATRGDKAAEAWLKEGR